MGSGGVGVTDVVGRPAARGDAMEWGQGGSNSKPVEMESDALPLRHSPLGITRKRHGCIGRGWGLAAGATLMADERSEVPSQLATSSQV